MKRVKAEKRFPTHTQRNRLRMKLDNNEKNVFFLLDFMAQRMKRTAKKNFFLYVSYDVKSYRFSVLKQQQ